MLPAPYQRPEADDQDDEEHRRPGHQQRDDPTV
jgi:hypothetical protein